MAEYLDNTLSDDRVPDFEKVCLDSDVHLAEVVACHQVLTLVLGEPAEIDPSARQRMYDLPQALAAQAAAPSRRHARCGNGRRKPTASRSPPRPVRVIAPRCPTISASPAAGSAIRRWPWCCWRWWRGAHWRPPASARSRARSWAIASTACWPARRPKRSRPTRPERPTVRPGQRVREDRRAGRVGQDGARHGGAGETHAARPYAAQEDRGRLGRRTALAAGEAGQDRGAQGREPHPARAGTGETGTGAKVNVPPRPVGIVTTEKQVLLRYDTAGNDWIRLAAPQGIVSSGDRLLALPTFQPVIALTAGVTVQLAAGSEIELLPPLGPGDGSRA